MLGSYSIKSEKRRFTQAKQKKKKTLTNAWFFFYQESSLKIPSHFAHFHWNVHALHSECNFNVLLLMPDINKYVGWFFFLLSACTCYHVLNSMSQDLLAGSRWREGEKNAEIIQRLRGAHNKKISQCPII